jgi:hypothetical protein
MHRISVLIYCVKDFPYALESNSAIFKNILGEILTELLPIYQ